MNIFQISTCTVPDNNQHYWILLYIFNRPTALALFLLMDLSYKHIFHVALTPSKQLVYWWRNRMKNLSIFSFYTNPHCFCLWKFLNLFCSTEGKSRKSFSVPVSFLVKVPNKLRMKAHTWKKLFALSKPQQF